MICDDHCPDDCPRCEPIDLTPTDRPRYGYGYVHDPTKRGPKPWWLDDEFGQDPDSRASEGGYTTDPNGFKYGADGGQARR